MALLPAGEVEEFVEKPSGNALERMANCSRNSTEACPFEASMGVYVFNRQALVSCLEQQPVLNCIWSERPQGQAEPALEP